MKPYHSILLLIAIVGCAIVTSINNYGCAKDYIIADMNQALAQTLKEKSDAWITPDTIADYRSHLKIAGLRETSVIYYAMDEDGGSLKSKKMTWRNGKGKKLEFQGFANCSMASVFAMSDQRLPMSLYAVAALWGLFSVYYFRRNRKVAVALDGDKTIVLTDNDESISVENASNKNCVVFGGIKLDSNRFLTLSNEEVSLTPMQSQLLTMFFESDSHRLSKQEICAALWPKKPDATDTLYTLVRRIKPILAQQGLTITTSRGKDYQLVATPPSAS